MIVEALDLAEKTGRPLKLAGLIQDQGYFDTHVRPRIDGKRVEYLGPAGPEARQTLLAGASALVHLVNFRRALRAERGGSDGLRHPRHRPAARFHAGDHPGRASTASSSAIPPGSERAVDREPIRSTGGRCANRSRQRFGVERMVDEYLALYHRIVPLIPRVEPALRSCEV